MQRLEAVSRTAEVSWYRLLGDYQGQVQRWVVSTPETIRICNLPEVAGTEFSHLLRQGMTKALATAPFKPLLGSVCSSRLCIMNFLRGGLNFDLRNALCDALGSRYHSTCFMSSQRFRRDGRWVVQEDMYRKMEIPDGAILLVGDVVATGVTVDNGFRVIENYLKEKQSTIAATVFFTIGCHKLEKLLEDVHRRFQEAFPGYRETHAVYLEGKFRLVDSATRLMIAIQGTDLIRRDCLLAPEFERSQYDSLGVALERCTIYDAGSRAFDVIEYLTDVIHYWEQVRRLARRGYTLREALLERWPESDYGDLDGFLAARRLRWELVPDDCLRELWECRQRRWSEEFTRWAATSAALESVCDDRLQTLQAILAEAQGER